MHYKKCVICGKKNGKKGDKQRDFMSKFPLNEHRCKEWVRFVGNPDLVYVPIEKLTQLKYVCGDHFERKDFNRKKTRLKRTAIPSLRPCAKALSEDVLLQFPFHIAAPKQRPIFTTSNNGTKPLNDTQENIGVKEKGLIESDQDVYKVVSSDDPLEDSDICQQKQMHKDEISTDNNPGLVDEDTNSVLEVTHEELLSAYKKRDRCNDNFRTTKKANWDNDEISKKLLKPDLHLDDEQNFQEQMDRRDADKEIKPIAPEDSVCRLCASVTTSSTRLSSRFLHLRTTVSNVIYECLGLNLYDNKGPDRVCDSCRITVEDIWKFRCMAHYTQRRFLQSDSQNERELMESNKFETTMGHPLAPLKMDPASLKNVYDLKPLRVLLKEMQKAIKNQEKIAADQNVTALVRYSHIVPYIWHQYKFRCSYCKIKFTKFDDLRQHTVLEHSKDETTIIPDFSSVDITVINCRLCSEPVTDLETLNNHLKIKHDKILYSDVKYGLVPYKFTEEEFYKCVVCEEKFAYMNSLRQHMHHHYPNFRCPKCKVPFTKELNLRDHMAVHEQRRHMCEHCGRAFTNRTSLLNHIRNTHDKKEFKCLQCSVSFTRPSFLQRHMEREHGAPQQIFKCTKCDFKSPYKVRLLRHNRLVHNRIKILTCPICQMEFLKPHELGDHIRAHTNNNRYECDVCGKKMNVKRHFERHVKNHETRPYLCTICKRTYVTEKSLESHLKYHQRTIDKNKQPLEQAVQTIR